MGVKTINYLPRIVQNTEYRIHHIDQSPFTIILEYELSARVPLKSLSMSQRWDEKGVEIDGEIAEDKYKYNEYKQHAAKRKYTLQAHCCYDSVGT